jgi:hypothetical protein
LYAVKKLVAYISTALCIQAGLQCNISAYTAQNMIHLKFNFCLLILDKISTEAVAALASMLVTFCNLMPMQYDVKYVLLNVCQGLELICIGQCFVKWFAISGEEMLSVDTYQTLYYRWGIEGGQPIYRRYADCRKIFALHSSY